MKGEKIYRAAPGARFSHKKAAIYGQALEALKKSLGRAPSTDDIVKAAKSPKSPLHDAFQWDVKKAAESYWKAQARSLLNHIDIVIIRDGEQEQCSAFFNVRTVPGSEVTVYEDVGSVASNPFLKRQVVAYALREAEGWSRKYKTYSSFPSIKIVCRAISQALKTGRKEARKVAK